MKSQKIHLPKITIRKGDEMQTPETVAAMRRLYELGWGARRIARELGCSRNTVKRHLSQEDWMPDRLPKRRRALSTLEEWLAVSFRQHCGNADVVRQELQRVHGLQVSLRTVERAVRPWRQALEAEARATVRFETPPGQQLQIDFGSTTVRIGGEPVVVRLFVATLGYSRRVFVAAFDHERQSAWLDGLEGAFHHFGGVPEEVLMDNARALVDAHDRITRVVVFNTRFLAFARYWGFQPRACAPCRARTKGKDERGVGSVKRNAIAGRMFDSWAALEGHLRGWLRTVADVRIHGTTGEPPLARFQRAEADALRPLNGRPPFHWIRELTRRVHADSCIEVDTNHYSVPWRLIGETVTVQIVDESLRVQRAGIEVARHVLSVGRRQRVIDPAHLAGVVGAPTAGGAANPAPPAADRSPAPVLLRPLAEYEAIAGGGW
ncbi:MAG: IS21 family transposase [Gammaproteobacteria bacterium]|nr:IS21 family transposase [Gammaproteobacteria bacterium]